MKVFIILITATTQPRRSADLLLEKATASSSSFLGSLLPLFIPKLRIRAQESQKNRFISWKKWDLRLPHHHLTIICTMHSWNWTFSHSFGAAEPILHHLINLEALHLVSDLVIWAAVWAEGDPPSSFHINKRQRNEHYKFKWLLSSVPHTRCWNPQDNSADRGGVGPSAPQVPAISHLCKVPREPLGRARHPDSSKHLCQINVNPS